VADSKVRIKKQVVGISLYPKTLSDIDKLCMIEQRSRSMMVDVLVQEAIEARENLGSMVGNDNVVDPWEVLKKRSRLTPDN